MAQKVPFFLPSSAQRLHASRWVNIPSSDGRQRPLAVAAVEDKISPMAVVALLNAICEKDYLRFSYGFPLGRGAHHTLMRSVSRDTTSSELHHATSPTLQRPRASA
jgi:hypothetical protein